MTAPSGSQHQDTHVAAYVWALPNLRAKILEYLPSKALITTLTLNKENLRSAAEILFAKILYHDCMKVEKACTSISRTRLYLSAVRHIDTTPPYQDTNRDRTLDRSPSEAVLFARYPRLRWVTYDCDTLELVDLDSSPPRFIHHILYDLKPHYVDDDDFPLERDEFPLDWDITSIIRHVQLNNCDEFDTERIAYSEVFFRTWLEKSGMFKIPVIQLEMDFLVPCKRLCEVFSTMYRDHHEMPKSIRLRPEEEAEGPNIIDVIEQLSSLVEKIDIMPPTSTDRSKVITSIYDFFSSGLNWSSIPDRKIKDLSVLLPLTPKSDCSLQELDIAYTGPHIGLTSFSLTLDVPSVQPNADPSSNVGLTDHVPSFSQIAKAMYCIGGTGCQYSLKIHGTEDMKTTSEIWTSLLRKEIWEIIRNETKLVGWRRLRLEERV
ncbi:uncharacterized protein IL334_006295 [Kwoniella shivajii]|uniref:F-box domain-containing protein n=1 Tax=Kwoniella shivajii TaxID=564305 RepID=A0ABZ1D5J2_9TREE|nr:hypothetical protein IL334_006295 [Kwoniella shivajii]